MKRVFRTGMIRRHRDDRHENWDDYLFYAPGLFCTHRDVVVHRDDFVDTGMIL